MNKKVTDYSLDIHKHVLASWAASSAASQAGFRFKAKYGLQLLLLAKSGKKTKRKDLIQYIKEIKTFKEQQDFNDWHSKTIDMMRSGGRDFNKILEGINKTKNKKLAIENYSYGIAAKLLNVYLKVFYLGDFGKNTFASFIHPPIDRLLLEELLKKESEFFKFDCEPFEHTSTTGSGKIPKWTQINEEEYKEIIKFIREFLHKNNRKGLWRIEYAWRGHQ